MMFYFFLGLLFGAIGGAVSYFVTKAIYEIRSDEMLELVFTHMRSRLKEIETYRAHLDDLVNRGALDPYRAKELEMKFEGAGDEPLARKWIKAAQAAREKAPSSATEQLNLMMREVSKDLGEVTGDPDRIPEIEGVAVLICADLIMRETRKKLEGKDLVKEFEEKFGKDMFTDSMNWM